MKKLAGWFVLFALLGMTGVAAASGGGRTVVIVNSTPYTLNEVYASSSDASGWDGATNLIAGQSIPSGGQLTLNVSSVSGGGEDGCFYDMMGVLYGAAQYAYGYQVNACTGNTWTISPGS